MEKLRCANGELYQKNKELRLEMTKLRYGKDELSQKNKELRLERKNLKAKLVDKGDGRHGIRSSGHPHGVNPWN